MLRIRRILLHRAEAESLENRLRMVGISRPGEHVGMTHPARGPKTEPSSAPAVTDVEVVEDEEGNLSVRFRDEEGNLVTDSLVDLFNSLDSGQLNQLRSGRFADLPVQLRTTVLHALSAGRAEGEAPLITLTETSLPSAASPRKDKGRKSMMAEYLGTDGGEMEFPDRNGNLEPDTVDVTDAVGERKKAAAVPIERVLYPHRFRTQGEVPRPLVDQRTEVLIRNQSKPRPYTNSFPELEYKPVS